MKRWNRIHIEQSETIITLLCRDDPAGVSEALLDLRQLLEAHIRMDPDFRDSHDPLHRKGLPPALDRMVSASGLTGVGPMACVAGVFAETALHYLTGIGVREAVVDNGGDIALVIQSPVYIGIYNGPSSPLKNLAFKVLPSDRPLGICTSSGTVGHSFSYGRADAAIVISHDIVLADAAATALGNRIRGVADLESCFDFLEPLREIQGAMAIIDDRVTMWGELPELCEIPVDASLITRGRISVS